MNVILFNGPPQSGKDTAADLLATWLEECDLQHPVTRRMFSSPLRATAYAMCGLDYANRTLDYETFKRTEWPQFGGVTGRQLMIDVSEGFLKPKYGAATLARLAIAGFNPSVGGTLIFSDSGFQVELDAVTQWFGVGRVLVVHVSRDGTSWEGDSRSYVDPGLGAIRPYPLPNNGSLVDLGVQLAELVTYCELTLGWSF